MPELTPEQLAYDIDDLRALQAMAGQRMQQLEQESQTVEQQLITEDLTKLTDAIDKEAILLGDATVEGSIRKIVGTTEDPPGLTSLRASKARQTLQSSRPRESRHSSGS